VSNCASTVCIETERRRQVPSAEPLLARNTTFVVDSEERTGERRANIDNPRRHTRLIVAPAFVIAGCAIATGIAGARNLRGRNPMRPGDSDADRKRVDGDPLHDEIERIAGNDGRAAMPCSSNLKSRWRSNS
jgi:hypothetical protein